MDYYTIDDLVKPTAPPSYTQGMLDALRADRQCGAGESWVKDRRVKGGGYCREKPKGRGGTAAAIVATGVAAAAAGYALRNRKPEGSNPFAGLPLVPSGRIKPDPSSQVKTLPPEGVVKIPTSRIASPISPQEARGRVQSATARNRRGMVVAGFAAGSVAGALLTERGLRNRVEKGRQEAAQQTAKEVVRVRQAAEQQYKSELDRANTQSKQELERATAQLKKQLGAERVKEIDALQKNTQAAIDRISQESESRIARERDTLTQEFKQQEQALRSRKEKEAAELQSANAKLSAQVAGMEVERTQVAERAIEEIEKAQTAAEARAAQAEKNAEASVAKQSAVLEEKYSQQSQNLKKQSETLEFEYQQRFSDLETQHAKRVEQLESAAREREVKQVAELEDRINEGIQQRLLSEREALTAQIRDEVTREEEVKRIAKGRSPRSLLDDDKEGVVLGASIARGLDPESAPDLPRQVRSAVDRIINRRVKEGFNRLNQELRDRFSEIQSMGGDRPPQTRNEATNRITNRWQAMEKTMLAQNRREAALADGTDEVRKTYREQMLEALERLRAEARGRGSYDADLVKRFDRESKKYHQDMMKRLDEAIEEALNDIRLDAFWKIIQIKGTPDVRAHTRRVRVGIQNELQNVIRSGKGRELDIKPLLEEGAVAVAGMAPGAAAPVAAGATRAVSRAWRLTYEDAVRNGLPGAFEGLGKLTKEEKQELLSDTITEVAATVTGTIAGQMGGAAGDIPLHVAGRSIDLAGPVAGISTGVTTSKAAAGAAKSIAQKLVKDAYQDSYWRCLSVKANR